MKLLGETLEIANHNTKRIFVLNKIISGGKFGPRLPAPSAYVDPAERDYLDFVSYVLLINRDSDIEVVVSNSRRWLELIIEGYETVTMTDMKRNDSAYPRLDVSP